MSILLNIVHRSNIRVLATSQHNTKHNSLEPNYTCKKTNEYGYLPLTNHHSMLSGDSMSPTLLNEVMKNNKIIYKLWHSCSSYRHNIKHNGLLL